MSEATLQSLLDLGNLILSSVNVIVGFSLFVYILTHNLRSPVARAFCALMAFVTIVHLVDVSINEVNSLEAARIWLKLQWIGIAFVPAAYFHFSDALLRTTGAVSGRRRFVVIAAYGLGLLFLALVALSDLIVDGVSRKDHMYHLVAAPGFWAFAAYYVLTALSGWLYIRRTRARCLTSTSRRRMSYLMLAFVAPSIGVFPYLLVPTTAQSLSANLIGLLTLLGNVGIALMTVVIGYTVAYEGVLLPDRVVKHSLIHFLLRGPVVAILVIAIMLTIPRVESILGVPRDTMLIVAVAGSVVTLQVVINLAKPAIDRITYRQDRKEMAWIQTIEQRLLTSTDLEQLLENTLIALCDLLQVESGFVVTMQGSVLSVRVFCGPAEAASRFLEQISLPSILQSLSENRTERVIQNRDFVLADGHWLLPLRSRTDEATTGILGIKALGIRADFPKEELEAVTGLVRRAELALEDMRLQQQVFALLRGLGNELDEIQAWRSTPQFVGDDTLQQLDMNPVHTAGFVQIVRDALGEFWGGPKLSQSPLLHMRIVRDHLPQHDNVPAKAVRAVLREAIERLRPDGERAMTAAEWVMYNILDLKFIQGHRIRDIVQRMAMSESDFYRKQRVAIEQVASTLAQMERTSERQALEERSDLDRGE